MHTLVHENVGDKYLEYTVLGSCKLFLFKNHNEMTNVICRVQICLNLSIVGIQCYTSFMCIM